MRILAAAIAASVLLASGAALACSCAPFTSAAEQAEAVDALFRARVISTRSVSGADYIQAITTFEVIEVMKAPANSMRAGQRVEVGHSVGDASCGMSFTPGAEDLVAAMLGEGRTLQTSLCAVPQFSDEAFREALRIAPE
jgi:hypothetical protein